MNKPVKYVLYGFLGLCVLRACASLDTDTASKTASAASPAPAPAASRPIPAPAVQRPAVHRAAAAVTRSALVKQNSIRPLVSDSRHGLTHGLTSAERTYFKAVSDGTGSLSEGLKRLTEQSGSAAGDPALIDDADWKMGTLGALAILDVGAGQIGKITPVPAGERGIDRKLKGIARQVNSLIQDYGNGVDHRDAALLERASRRMEDIARRSQELTPVIQAKMTSQ